MSTKAERRDNPNNNGGVRDKYNNSANDNRHRPQPQQGYEGFKPMGEKQQAQGDLIDKNDIVFSVGPAGTGKTYVAIAKAVEAFSAGKYDSILLCRPAVEAGKTIGFLPGDQNDKMAPYMRPLYDELDKVYGKGNYAKFITSEENPNGVIEVAPVGTMRGRTFKNTFVIIDEAQNLKDEELKMVLTRLGAGSKIVITGDPQQVDLDPPEQSGLMRFVKALDGVEGVAVHTYGAEDVMRHPTVKRIIDRLDQLEKKGQQNQPVAKTATP
jgi:phosphate starvation-inducible PhoH-like protein